MPSKIDLHSKIKDVYANPIGHDILYKLLLQLNKSEKLITNPIVKNLRLKTLMTVTKRSLGNEFFVTFLELLNSEEDVPRVSSSGIIRRWWKEAVFYQINTI